MFRHASRIGGVIAVLGAWGRCLAGTRTWTGPAIDLWSSGDVWCGGVPASGEANPGTIVVFGTSSICDGGTLVFPRTDVLAGAGYFLLPGITPTASLSPILSGEVLLTPP